MTNTTNEIVNSETAPIYKVTVKPRGAARAKTLTLTDDEILTRAREIMRERATQLESMPDFTQPSVAKRFFTDYLIGAERENFVVAFLDSQHRLLAVETLFKGTINAAPVYPREVIKRAMGHNAAALLLCHNHPSGVTEPSQADERVTQRIKTACELLDLRVLDHIIVGHTESAAVSFAERGLL